MDYVNKFEVYLDEKKVSRATQSAYMADIQDFQVWLSGTGKPLEKAQVTDVASYMERLSRDGKSISTQNRKLASIKSFYSFMKKAGRINTNPADDIKTQKVERNELEFL
ncbi:MAG: site-specific integrase, partial [Bacillota bacterium]|nr:site-specific integrase [Bacillota bacterium]